MRLLYLLHISHYVPPVMAEAVSCLDVKASFLQVSLPRETLHLFRCRVEDGTLVELTRLPMGYKASPEILQIITSAIARATTVVHPSGPHLHRCVSTYGSVIYALQGRKAMRHCGKPKCFVMRTVVTHTWGDRESGATQYTFLGVQFDHTRRAVSLSERFVRSVRAMPELNSSTIAGMEVTASRFFYAAAIFGHAFMCPLLSHQGSATTIIRT
ncbi:hypothetical protein C3747_1g295 [Trypanosoma cruzi]|uniref:Target of rapamycin (TOR) kinase 1 n=1 Tax=Trypanosoma cruzi TaxID=5693 RepID=A0A2V2XQD9_TRYCR|nr:hypothetical protein C3747_1g295 [Trypanosoma cruzi]RNC39975.1 rab1 small GTP-binding protein [Trypanosoma cruzi]